MLFLGRERPTGENRLNVSAYAANGGAKFVRDVIAHLLLEKFVFSLRVTSVNVISKLPSL